MNTKPKGDDMSLATAVVAAIALIPVAEGNPSNSTVNVREQAVGRYQLRPIYVADANRILGSMTYRHADARDPVKAREICRIVLTEYGFQYARKTGRPPTPAVLLRIHNGGPYGWRKRATLAYIKKAGLKA